EGGWATPGLESSNSMIPGELRRIDQRPVEVAEPVFALVAGCAGEAAGEVGGFLRSGAAGQDGEVGGLDGRAVVGGQARDPRGGVEEVPLDPIADDLAVHQQEALGDRAGPGVELVLTRVAVAADEVVPPGRDDQAREPVGLRTEGRERG